MMFPNWLLIKMFQVRKWTKRQASVLHSERQFAYKKIRKAGILLNYHTMAAFKKPGCYSKRID